MRVHNPQFDCGFVALLLVPTPMAQSEAFPTFVPRQAGKTTLAIHAFPEFTYTNLEEPDTRMLVASRHPGGTRLRYPRATSSSAAHLVHVVA